MTETLRPETEDQLADAIRWAVASEAPLAVRGRGTKDGLGRPVESGHALDTSGLAGILQYEPSELVLSARAGTPLEDIEAALDGNHQELAFEPVDFRAVLGEADGAGAGTAAGLVACNMAGPRRVKAGAVRDHVLGFRGVSGRGELFKSGGRVMKNVTGFDLSKLVAGSYGTLAVLGEVTFKVLPRPEKARTVLVMGLDDAGAVAAMRDALNSPYEVSSAAHLGTGAAAASAVEHVRGAGGAVTAVRVEGPEPSVEARCASLRRLLGGRGDIEELHTANSRTFWREVRDARPFARTGGGDRSQVWRLSVPPAEAPRIAAALREATGGETLLDWGGGLIWLRMPSAPDAAHAAVRATFEGCGGHATLIRADAGVRAAVPVFQPPAPGLDAITRRMKQGFDPQGVLNPGRMYAGL